MKSLKMVVAAVVLVLAGMVGFAALGNSEAYACTCPIAGQTCTTSVAECGVKAVDSDNGNTKLMDKVQVAINVVLSVVGVVAVVVIILGGINFITSQGDTSKVTKAKNTILYGVVGLVIALLAFAIVNFVLSSVFGGGSGGEKPEWKAAEHPGETCDPAVYTCPR